MRRLCPMFMALVGAWFGFANPWLHFPAAIVLLPAALTLAVRQASGPYSAFRTGLLTTLPGYAAALYWLAIPVHDYGAMPWVLALPCPVLVALVPAAYAGVYCLGLHAAGERINSLPGILCAGLLWAALELARNYLLTGFPWLTMSTALVPWPRTLGLAGWIGAFGLSGLIAALGHVMVQERKFLRLAALPLIALLLLPGLMRPAPQAARTVNVAMIQGNIDQARKWDAAVQTDIVTTYTALTNQALAQGPTDLVIWPETSMPFFFQDPSVLTTTVSETVRHKGVPLLAGSPAYTMLAEPAVPPYVLRNRAYLLDDNGTVKSWYDKEHLVPFGEYVPLGEWLPFIKKLVPGDAEFRPGADQPPLACGPMNMGVLICYEAIFPELAQDHVERGANVLVNISNDAWFGASSAPWQHLDLSAMRAVEQNRYVLRCTNTGLTTVIAPDGSMQPFPQSFTAAVLRCSDIRLLTETTFFHDHFTVINLTFVLAALGMLAWLRRTTR